MDKNELKNLKKRYLIWLYKTVKEEWDKVERKFTQLEIDKFILKELSQSKKGKGIDRFIADFKEYIRSKEKQGLSLKYAGKKIKPEYSFLSLKLGAIEKAILKEFGRNTLKEIKALYEKEMIERILKSTETK